jgi:hypothetical protein
VARRHTGGRYNSSQFALIGNRNRLIGVNYLRRPPLLSVADQPALPRRVLAG